MSSEQSSKLVCAKDAFLAETWWPRPATCKAKATRALGCLAPSRGRWRGTLAKGVTILTEQGSVSGAGGTLHPVPWQKYQQASTFKGGRGDAGGRGSPPRGYWPSGGLWGGGHCSLVFSGLALAGTLRAGRRPMRPYPAPHRGHLSWAEKDPNSPEWLPRQLTGARLLEAGHLRTIPSGARPGPQPSEPQGSQGATKG